MNQAISPQHENELTKDKLPQCKRCHQPVENLVISPHPDDEEKVIIEYNCHGETISQEVSTSLPRRRRRSGPLQSVQLTHERVDAEKEFREYPEGKELSVRLPCTTAVAHPDGEEW
jgi:hypothetical protein